MWRWDWKAERRVVAIRVDCLYIVLTTVAEEVWDANCYLSFPPALRLRSTPAKPATLTSTSTTAWPLPPPSPRRPSAGPWTEHMIDVLPMDRYEEPELAGLVEIWACRRRSSFQRRPSRRSRVSGYVVEVSRGIVKVVCGFAELSLRKRNERDEALN